MKKYFIYVALVLTTLIYGCSNNKALKEETKTVKAEIEIDFSEVITVGNHSYIPLNIHDARPADRTHDILVILDKFEKIHPELEITSWSIEKQEGVYMPGHIFGLWVNHCPK